MVLINLFHTITTKWTQKKDHYIKVHHPKLKNCWPLGNYYPPKMGHFFYQSKVNILIYLRTQALCCSLHGRRAHALCMTRFRKIVQSIKNVWGYLFYCWTHDHKQARDLTQYNAINLDMLMAKLRYTGRQPMRLIFT